ncbi:hypothetical protein PICSAR138_04590 [Mycobacterium avium subsp. paratuberculosis]|nr:hypothetical protein PICSAR138_04590 [Mycobacterium avium subsp. paratuberculosis]
MEQFVSGIIGAENNLGMLAKPGAAAANIAPALAAPARSAGAGVPPRYGVRLTVMPRPPAAG